MYYIKARCFLRKREELKLGDNIAQLYFVFRYAGEAVMVVPFQGSKTTDFALGNSSLHTLVVVADIQIGLEVGSMPD